MERVIVWTPMSANVIALARYRKRDDGYLRCPVGHHMTETIRAIESIDGVLDVDGLDGWMRVVCKDKAGHRAIVNEISRIYQCENLQSHQKFWSVVPE